METPRTIITTTSKWKFGENHNPLALFIFLAVLATAAFYLQQLLRTDRPMHADEAVHAVVLGDLLKGGVYRYNPGDSHGPLLYFIAYPILRVLGVSSLEEMQAWQLRIVPALAGWLTIISLYLWRGFVRPSCLAIAALLLAGSAPFVYYQDYFIHESLFVLLSLILASMAIRLLDSPTPPLTHLVWIGTVLGLLFGTKETAPIVCLALLGAAALVYWPEVKKLWYAFSRKHFCAVIVPFLFFTVLLYSSFGLNPHGLFDWCEAQIRFLHRAGGEGHEKPLWTYVIWLLWPSHFAIPWSGASIVLAALSFFLKPRKSIRFVACYALITGVIYSLIPYKTPWLELNILAPATLPAGYTLIALMRGLIRVANWPEISFVAVAGVLGSIGFVFTLETETNALCFDHPNDDRNPLAYSPTVNDVNNLEQALAQYPKDTFIAVITPDYWPLPWYLRRFSQVGYWNNLSEIPQQIPAGIVITSPDLLPQVQTHLPADSQVRYFGLRPEVLVVLVTTK